jgi:SAM-dependent methyltransferase
VSTIAILARYRRGELSASMALGAMLVAERDLTALAAALDAADATDLRRMLDRHAAGAADALSILRQHNQGSLKGIERVRQLFDSAVALSPTASVALYSLGDEALLAGATAELVELLDRLRILAPTRHVLDVGCGTGRLEQALSPRVASVTGIDISPRMIEAARVRCSGLANVRLHLTPGRDLVPFTAGTFDAVLAIDSFPYLYEAGGTGLVREQLREIDRVLRPGGDLLVMNLSYRGDLTLDRADAATFAAELGLELLRNGSSDLRSWDGTTFHFRKPA